MSLPSAAPSIDCVLGILPGRIRASMRRGTQAPAATSRLSMRAALETGGTVHVSRRGGWFVVGRSPEGMQDASQARCAVGMGTLHTLSAVEPQAAAELRQQAQQLDPRQALRLSHPAPDNAVSRPGP